MKDVVARKRAAARKRVDEAIRHLARALREANAAQADLSTVVGAPSLHPVSDEIRRTLNRLAMHNLDPSSKCELDHDPTPAELRRGHGRNHGCGNRKAS